MLTDILGFLPQDEIGTLCQSLSSWNDHTGDLSPAFHARPVRCHAVLSQPGSICTRVNNLQAYMDLNRQAARVLTAIVGSRDAEEDTKVAHVHATSQIQPKAQVVGVAFFFPYT